MFIVLKIYKLTVLTFLMLLLHFQYFLFPALRDNRIELVRASWHELSISVSDVSLSDEGQYTCSLFTMPVKTSKAYLTVLGKCKGLTLCSHKPERCLLLQQRDSITHMHFENPINRCNLIPSLLHYDKRHSKITQSSSAFYKQTKGSIKICMTSQEHTAILFLSQQQTPDFLFFNESFCIKLSIDCVQGDPFTK